MTPESTFRHRLPKVQDQAFYISRKEVAKASGGTLLIALPSDVSEYSQEAVFPDLVLETFHVAHIPGLEGKIKDLLIAHA